MRRNGKYAAVDFADALYRGLQFAFRKWLGAKSLDEILADKVTRPRRWNGCAPTHREASATRSGLSTEVAAQVRPRLSSLGHGDRLRREACTRYSLRPAAPY
jgi:hypothetical protein